MNKGLDGKRVLVTGADGFIGSHLVEMLVEKMQKLRHFRIIIPLIIGVGLRRLTVKTRLKYYQGISAILIIAIVLPKI
jgi:nucleoside-diphosphate-sugar epimerase